MRRHPHHSGGVGSASGSTTGPSTPTSLTSTSIASTTPTTPTTTTASITTPFSPPSPHSRPPSLSHITRPTHSEHCLHVEYDPETHTFIGLPREWQGHLPNGARAEVVSTGYLRPELAPPKVRGRGRGGGIIGDREKGGKERERERGKERARERLSKSANDAHRPTTTTTRIINPKTATRIATTAANITTTAAVTTTTSSGSSNSHNATTGFHHVRSLQLPAQGSHFSPVSTSAPSLPQHSSHACHSSQHPSLGNIPRATPYGTPHSQALRDRDHCYDYLRPTESITSNHTTPSSASTVTTKLHRSHHAPKRRSRVTKPPAAPPPPPTSPTVTPMKAGHSVAPLAVIAPRHSSILRKSAPSSTTFRIAAHGTTVTTKSTTNHHSTTRDSSGGNQQHSKDSRTCAAGASSLESTLPPRIPSPESSLSYPGAAPKPGDHHKHHQPNQDSTRSRHSPSTTRIISTSQINTQPNDGPTPGPTPTPPGSAPDAVAGGQPVQPSPRRISIHPAWEKAIAKFNANQEQRQRMIQGSPETGSGPVLGGTGKNTEVVVASGRDEEGSAGRSTAGAKGGMLVGGVALGSDEDDGGVGMLQAGSVSLVEWLDGIAEDQDPTPLFTDLQPVAAGESGTVYRALDSTVGSTVAIKLIHTSERAGTTEKLRTLRKELVLMRSSRHQCIVELVGTYVKDDTVWIVMEWVSCGSLAEFLERFRFCGHSQTDPDRGDGDGLGGWDEDKETSPEDETFGESVIKCLSYDILSALSFLHLHHRLHRDIRSDNLLLSHHGKLKISDFAYATQLNPPTRPTASQVVGTPFWMSPELCEGREYAEEVDVWAFGATVREMIEGVPFYFECDEAEAMRNIVTLGAPPLPQAIAQNCSSVLRDMLACSLAKDASKRWSAARLLTHPFFERMGSRARLRKYLSRLQQQD